MRATDPNLACPPRPGLTEASPSARPTAGSFSVAPGLSGLGLHWILAALTRGPDGSAGRPAAGRQQAVPGAARSSIREPLRQHPLTQVLGRREGHAEAAERVVGVHQELDAGAAVCSTSQPSGPARTDQSRPATGRSAASAVAAAATTSSGVSVSGINPANPVFARAGFVRPGLARGQNEPDAMIPPWTKRPAPCCRH